MNTTRTSERRSRVEVPVRGAAYRAGDLGIGIQKAKLARKPLRRREGRQAALERGAPAPRLPPVEPPAEVLALLAALPDVGETRARALAASLGSFTNLASADLRRLLEVPGIGPQTAIRIYEALRAHQAPQHGATPTHRPERQSA